MVRDRNINLEVVYYPRNNDLQTSKMSAKSNT